MALVLEITRPSGARPKASKANCKVGEGGVHPAGWLESFNFFYNTKKKFGPFCNSSAVLFQTGLVHPDIPYPTITLKQHKKKKKRTTHTSSSILFSLSYRYTPWDLFPPPPPLFLSSSSSPHHGNFSTFPHQGTKTSNQST